MHGTGTNDFGTMVRMGAVGLGLLWAGPALADACCLVEVTSGVATLVDDSKCTAKNKECLRALDHSDYLCRKKTQSTTQHRFDDDSADVMASLKGADLPLTLTVKTTTDPDGKNQVVRFGDGDVVTAVYPTSIAANEVVITFSEGDDERTVALAIGAFTSFADDGWSQAMESPVIVGTLDLATGDVEATLDIGLYATPETPSPFDWIGGVAGHYDFDSGTLFLEEWGEGAPTERRVGDRDDRPKGAIE